MPTVLPQVLRLCLGLAVVGVACAECVAAAISFGTCPAVARYLMAAGLAAFLGCAPLTATQVATILRIGDSASSRSRRARVRREHAEADGFEELLRRGTRNPAASQRQTVQSTDVAAAAAAAAAAAPDTSVPPTEDNAPTQLDPDIRDWVRQQQDSDQLQLISDTAPRSHSLLRALRQFVSGIREFYRPDASAEQREQRNLVLLLLCLPASFAYALPLYALRYPLPNTCASAPPPLLWHLVHTAVWLRVAAAGAALLACFAASGVDLLRRCRRRRGRQ